MLSIQGRRLVIGLFTLIAVSSFVTPASYAIGAESQNSSNPNSQAARIASKLTPSQLETIAKLDAKELAVLSKMDRKSLETISKMDPNAIATVSRMDSRAFGVASKMDRNTMSTVSKLDKDGLNAVSKLNKNSINAMAKLDSQGKLSNIKVQQSVGNVAKAQSNASTPATSKTKKRNSFF